MFLLQNINNSKLKTYQKNQIRLENGCLRPVSAFPGTYESFPQSRMIIDFMRF